MLEHVFPDSVVLLFKSTKFRSTEARGKSVTEAKKFVKERQQVWRQRSHKKKDNRRRSKKKEERGRGRRKGKDKRERGGGRRRRGVAWRVIKGEMRPLTSHQNVRTA